MLQKNNTGKLLSKENKKWQPLQCKTVDYHCKKKNRYIFLTYGPLTHFHLCHDKTAASAQPLIHEIHLNTNAV